MTLNVSTENFEDVWERVEPWLIHALERSGSADTIADVKAAVANGSCLLFHHQDGAAVCLIDRQERVPTFRVWLAGGEMHALEEMLPNAEIVARAMGCERIAFLGRTGWQRSFLAKAGFTPRAVDMQKTLEVAHG